MLDFKADTHLCNDRTRFKLKYITADDDILIADKIIYLIKAFNSVKILI
jgi:hypothetical protein